MRTTLRLPAVLLTVTALAFTAACGGGDDGSADTSAAPATTAAGSATSTTDGSGDAATGTVVLEDGFDDDSNQWTPEQLDTETATGEVADGAMTFSVSESPSADAPAGQVALPTVVWPSVLDDQADALTDVRVETVVSFTEGSIAGLSCRIADPTGNDLRGYDLTVSSVGVAAIVEYDAAGNPARLARNPELAEGEDGTIPEDPAFEYDPAAGYELAAECTGGNDGEPAHLALFLDGEEVVSVDDAEDPIPSGTAGVNYGESTISTEANGFTPFGVSFDNWRVIDLAGAAG